MCHYSVDGFIMQIVEQILEISIHQIIYTQ